MIIINKEKILYTLGIVAMFIFIYSMTSYNVRNSSQKEIATMQTVALPVNNKVIVIDAGHGIPDEGAQSSNRNNRGGKQFKNSVKITKFAGTVRGDGDFDKVRWECHL